MRAEMSHGNIADYERGRKEPGLGAMVRIARALGVSLGELIGLDEEAGPAAVEEEASAEALARELAAMGPEERRVLLDMFRLITRGRSRDGTATGAR